MDVEDRRKHLELPVGQMHLINLHRKIQLLVAIAANKKRASIISYIRKKGFLSVNERDRTKLFNYTVGFLTYRQGTKSFEFIISNCRSF